MERKFDLNKLFPKNFSVSIYKEKKLYCNTKLLTNRFSVKLSLMLTTNTSKLMDVKTNKRVSNSTQNVMILLYFSLFSNLLKGWSVYYMSSRVLNI